MISILLAAPGEPQVVSLPLDVLRVALPLCIYFALMFVSTFAAAWALDATYDVAASIAFTATGNNFGG